MPADFAGALQAIKDKFTAEWVLGGNPRTRVAEVNKEPGAPWPPKGTDGLLASWLLIAPEGSGVIHRGFGKPGSQQYIYYGHVRIHVYIPVGGGTEDAFLLAIAAGEIFRAKKFYDDVSPGCYVRTWAPQVDGGGPGDDDGAWFRVTATIPFDYYHRG
ncbi:hypothetical protein OZ411_01295 [Bradyrhizobium sp. Arg237L]|uniref:hypothetical protein n=1 Tax=Bradyrhizobium sp. Arg237L TaxID=3003352 RepID=UPI00249DA766|nr:hypothetical protein [Bradyrhizobium sp. Arg237L]MDI4231448.1 hypothetical protein [Bradyrhizobium sp. Arg237L]